MGRGGVGMVGGWWGGVGWVGEVWGRVWNGMGKE